MSIPPAPFWARLHYIHLSSADPEGLARFYAEVLDMTAREEAGGWVCSAPDRCVLVSKGAPKTLVSVGYAVTDSAVLQQITARAGANIGRPDEFGAAALQPGAVALRDTSGNCVMIGTAPSPAPRASNNMQARLQHVVMGSTEATLMADFYSSVIGFRRSDEVLDERGGMRTCFLRSDEEHHSFAVFETSTNSFDHHCYEVRDWNAIRDWGDRLSARRVPIKWGPGRHGPGNNLFLFFHDRDGNWVELSAELERVTEDRPTGHWPHEERTLNLWGAAYLRS